MTLFKRMKPNGLAMPLGLNFHDQGYRSLAEFALGRKRSLTSRYNKLSRGKRGRLVGATIGGAFGRLGASLAGQNQFIGLAGGAGLGAALGNRLPKSYTQKKKSLRNLYERP